ncbi:unnamed protein product [Caenorhabditis angaria]|uniref:Uncharacterized protein n=1 Tax=Caenorhabditis angaria TaxID=860376 RepID=A0A9P1J3P9_9PELO|nr:unnamed protein product [Caenorhabditis angaria]
MFPELPANLLKKKKIKRKYKKSKKVGKYSKQPTPVKRITLEEIKNFWSESSKNLKTLPKKEFSLLPSVYVDSDDDVEGTIRIGKNAKRVPIKYDSDVSSSTTDKLPSSFTKNPKRMKMSTSSPKDDVPQQPSSSERLFRTPESFKYDQEVRTGLSLNPKLEFDYDDGTVEKPAVNSMENNRPVDANASESQSVAGSLWNKFKAWFNK